MDCDVTIRDCNVRLAHQNPRTILYNHVNDLVNCNVLEGEIQCIDSIIDPSAPGEDKLIISCLSPGCPFFAITGKLLMYK